MKYLIAMFLFTTSLNAQSERIIIDASESWAAAGAIWGRPAGYAPGHYLRAREKTGWITRTTIGGIGAWHSNRDSRDLAIWVEGVKESYTATRLRGSRDLSIVPALKGSIRIKRMPPQGSLLKWHGGSCIVGDYLGEDRHYVTTTGRPFRVGDSGGGVFHDGDLVGVITHKRDDKGIVEEVK